jgi:predicted RNA binding protein YcfA (HicA-like mRNA interferase family)
VTKLPAISGRDAVKALRKIGYEIDHQAGSHMMLGEPRILFGA